MQSISSISNEHKEHLRFYAKKLGYSSEQVEVFEDVMDTVRTILDKKVRPKTMEWDRQGTKLVNGKLKLPNGYQEVINELIMDNELLSWFVPEDFGGFGYSNIFSNALTSVMAEYDMSLQVGTLISLSVMEALVIYHRPEYEQYLSNFIKGKHTGYVAFTEPQAGSNLENVKSTSMLDGDEYVLNGSKIFISNGGHAEAGLFLAKNMVDGRAQGTNVFYVEGLDGIEILRLEDKSGLKANPTAQLQFNNVRVPKENLIADAGNGYRKVLERLMGMRTGVVAQGVGAVSRALELAESYADQRIQFGKPINTFHGVKRKLDEMKRQLPRMLKHCYLASFALDRYNKGYIPYDIGASGHESELAAVDGIPGVARGALVHYFVSQAKIYTSEIANLVLYDAQQIFGGNGFIAENEINKLTRDVRVLPIYEGTSEIHEWLISRAKPALELLPKFKVVSSEFDGTTVYERMLFEKFPSLKGSI